MISAASTVEQYLAELPAERRAPMAALRKLILRHLPPGYEERMQYGMIGYGVPLSRYPDTYNGQPLGLVALASQKQYMALYLMAVYADPAKERKLAEAFVREGKKLDKGKACIRFKSLDALPLEAIGELVGSTSVDEFIALHEASRGPKARRPPARKAPARKASARATSARKASASALETSAAKPPTRKASASSTKSFLAQASRAKSASPKRRPVRKKKRAAS